ncbi:MAG: hypothetical protein DHS20C18_51040 [Saprospiraceae bacterium]|nr:MAG: hypothetical protein DHS20C18_51040 [Saprospiraceae bacterium]
MLIPCWHLCLLYFTSSLAAQTTADQPHLNEAYQLKTAINGTFLTFTTDQLQQIYTVTTNNELVKYNIEGAELFRYSNNRLGQLQSVDASNPLNPLLFYPDYQIAIILDRTLNPNTQVNFLELEEQVQSSVITLGSDNQIWLYDEFNFQLKKLSQSGQITDKSEDMSLLFSNIPEIKQLEADHIHLVANAPETGLLVFDNFGQFDKLIPIKNIDYIQLEDRRLFYQKEGQYFVYNFRTLAETPLTLPFHPEASDFIRLQKNYLFRLKKDRLEIYSLQ